MSSLSQPINLKNRIHSLGTEDPTVPFSSAENLKTICETNEIDFVYYPLEGRGHGPWGATVNGKSLSDLSFDFIVQNQSLNVE